MLRFDWSLIPSSPSSSPQATAKTSPRSVTPKINIQKLSQTLSTLYLTLQNKEGLEVNTLRKISDDLHNNADGFCCPTQLQEWMVRNANVYLELDDILNLVLFVKIYSSVEGVSIKEGYECIINNKCSLLLSPSTEMKRWTSEIKRMEKKYHRKVAGFNDNTTLRHKKSIKRLNNKVVPQDRYSCSSQFDEHPPGDASSTTRTVSISLEAGEI